MASTLNHLNVLATENVAHVLPKSPNTSGDGSIGPVRIIEEANKRQRALTRIGLRFGSSLTSVQAKRLRQRAETGSKNEVVRERLAEQGADVLDLLSSTILSIDKRLGK